MSKFLQVTPSQIIDIGSIAYAFYTPINELEVTLIGGNTVKYYGKTAEKLWKVLQDSSIPLEAF